MTFLRGVAVHAVETGCLATASGDVPAKAIVVCPGDDLATLFPDALEDVTRSMLRMLRLAAPGFPPPATTIMSGLGLTRYRGYATLPEAPALQARLMTEQPAQLANGVHLIVAQGTDGALIVGDSHHDGKTPDPFSSEAVDQLILDEFRAVFGAVPPVLERWTGTDASAATYSLVTTPVAAGPARRRHQRHGGLDQLRPCRRRDRRSSQSERPCRSFAVEAVVFDWAGTMIDHGCRAPVVALRRVFADAGVVVSEAEARADMGRAKRDHIRAILAVPRVAAAWAATTGGAASEEDVTRLHDAVEPLMRSVARDCAELIPGAASLAATLQAHGVRIGSCTGTPGR